MGVPFEEIMDAAAWSRPQTFARFYLKDLPAMRGRFSRAVMVAAGTAARNLSQILPQLMLNGGTLLPMRAGKDFLIKQEIRSNFFFMINTYLRTLPSLLYPPLGSGICSLKGGIRPIW